MNTVWFDAILAIFLGLLAFAGTQAINAVFALSVTGLYFAYAVPITVRFTGDNDFKPGPFHLGIFVSSLTNYCHYRLPYPISILEPSYSDYRCPLHGIYGNRLLIPVFPANECHGHELHRRGFRRGHDTILGLLLLPEVWWRLLV